MHRVHHRHLDIQQEDVHTRLICADQFGPIGIDVHLEGTVPVMLITFQITKKPLPLRFLVLGHRNADQSNPFFRQMITLLCTD